jgi:hypothetical protein
LLVSLETTAKTYFLSAAVADQVAANVIANNSTAAEPRVMRLRPMDCGREGEVKDTKFSGLVHAQG